MAAGFAGLRSTAQKCWGGSWIRGPEVTGLAGSWVRIRLEIPAGWLAAGCGLGLRWRRCWAGEAAELELEFRPETRAGPVLELQLEGY